jgi:hypothetical protein
MCENVVFTNPTYQETLATAETGNPGSNLSRKHLSGFGRRTRKPTRRKPKGNFDRTENRKLVYRTCRDV